MKTARLWLGFLLAAVLTSPTLAATYTVRAGDTLYSLARAAGITVAQLQALNGLTSPNLKVGQVLVLPDPPTPLPPPAPTPLSPPPPSATSPSGVRVSRPGCCAGATWTLDSAALTFLDRPPGREVGLYQVPADGSATEGTWRLPPTLLSRDGRYGLQPTGAATARAVRLDGLPSVSVSTSGQGAVWSSGGQLAWPTYGTAGRNDWIPLTVWVCDPFAGGAGPKPRRVLTVYGGRLVGWLNETTLLLTGRLTRQDARRSLLALDMATGRTQVLAQGQMFSGVQPSPDGSSVLFRVTLDTPGRNGMFVVDSKDGALTPFPVFGSARWQDETRVLVVPFEPGVTAHRLVQVDVTTGSTEELPSLGDQIANDDWQVAPDGTRVVYLSLRERALRVLTLPAPLGDLPGQP